jgi:ribosomal protein S18 acetylase RimI-like enzyme
MARGRPDLFREPVVDDPAERRRLREYITAVMAASDEQILVAAEQDQVLGMVHVFIRTVPAAATVPFRRPCREGWIQHVAVSAEHRRHGLGKTLDREARAWAKAQGAQTVGLQVWAHNQAAAKFFEHLGYRPRSYHLYDH